MEASAFRAPVALAGRRSGVLLRLRNDEQLVALFRQGNEDAFRLIHDRYRQRLSAYARQMLGGSVTDADDAMQDVFLRAYSALRADDRPVTLRAWLYRVAHNRCIDHLRRPASQPTLELSDELRPLPATTGDPILAAERREDLQQLVLDVRALPEHQRSALLMREMEGLSYQELAGALSITIPAVKSLLVRARMGLVEAQQARDTPCLEIRSDIVDAYERGVRATGRVRRHVRECPGCAGYRTTLKGVSKGLSSLNPSTGSWSSLVKLVGLGAGGSSAGGAAAAGGGGAVGASISGTAMVGAGAAATKIAAVVCCAAVLGGGVEASRRHAPAKPDKATPAATGHAVAPSVHTSPAATPAPAGVPAGKRVAANGRLRRAAGSGRVAPRAPRFVVAPTDATIPGSLDGAADATIQADPSGGETAPADDPATDADTTTADPAAAGVLKGLSGTSTSGSGSTASSSSSGSPVTPTTDSASSSGTSGTGSAGTGATGGNGSTTSTTGPGAPGTGTSNSSALGAGSAPAGAAATSGTATTAPPSSPAH